MPHAAQRWWLSLLPTERCPPGRERTWALQSDRPGLEYCVSHCINQLRLSYAAVTNKPNTLVACNNKSLFLTQAAYLLQVGCGSVPCYFHIKTQAKGASSIW